MPRNLNSWSQFSKNGIKYSYAQWETETATWTLYTQRTEVVSGYTYAIGSPTYFETTKTTMSDIRWHPVALSTISPTPTCQMQTFKCTRGTYSVPSGCTVQGGNVQLLYWPTATAKSKGSLGAHLNSTTLPLTQKPVTALYKNVTLISPSIYIDFKTAFALDNCGRTVGGTHAGAMLSLDPDELYTVQADFDYFVVTTTVRDRPRTTTFYQSAPINYGDLTGLPPGAAYQAMPICVAEGCDVITPSRYHPQLVLPTQVRALDAAWETCGLDWQGLWDPPIALQPAAVIDPVTTPTSPQQTVPASPQSTLNGPASQTSLKVAPLATASPSGASIVWTADPAPSATNGNGEAQPAPVATVLPYASTSDTVITSVQVALQPSPSYGTDTDTASSIPSDAVDTGTPTVSISSQSSAAPQESDSDSVAYSKSYPLEGQPSPTNAYEVLNEAQQAGSPSSTAAESVTVTHLAGSPQTATPIASGETTSGGSHSLSIGLTTSLYQAAAPSGDQAASASASGQPTVSDAASTSSDFLASEDPTLVSPTTSFAAGVLLTIDSQTLTAIRIAPSNGRTQAAVSVGEQTMVAGSDPRVINGHTLSAASDGIVVDGTLVPFGSPTRTTSPSTLSEEAVLTVGSSVVTAVPRSDGAVQLGSQTLLPEGSATALHGHTFSAASNGIVQDGTAVPFSPASIAASKSETVVLPLGSETVTALPASQSGVWVFGGGQALSVGGPALTSNGHTLSAAAGGLLEDGTLLDGHTTLLGLGSSDSQQDVAGTDVTTITTSGAFLPAVATAVPSHSTTAVVGVPYTPTASPSSSPSSSAATAARGWPSSSAGIGIRRSSIVFAALGCAWVLTV